MERESASLVSAFLLSSLLAASAANAQQVLDASVQSVSAGANYNDFNGSNFGNHGVATDTSGLDISLSEHRAYTGDGFDGVAAADMTLTFSPSNPGLGGTFDSLSVCANATAEHFTHNIPNHFDERAYGEAFGRVTFTVATTTPWSWTGSWSGGSSAAGYLSRGYAVLALLDHQTSSYALLDTRDSINTVGDWNAPFSYSGTLSPGKYDVIWLVSADQHGYYLNGAAIGDSWASMCSTFTVPAPAASVLLGAAGLTAAVRRRRR